MAPAEFHSAKAFSGGEDSQTSPPAVCMRFSRGQNPILIASDSRAYKRPGKEANEFARFAGVLTDGTRRTLGRLSLLADRTTFCRESLCVSVARWLKPERANLLARTFLRPRGRLAEGLRAGSFIGPHKRSLRAGSFLALATSGSGSARNIRRSRVVEEEANKRVCYLNRTEPSREGLDRV